MKTTVDLPEELVRELKVRAAQEGRTMKDLWTELFTKMLKEPGKTITHNQRMPPSAVSK